MSFNEGFSQYQSDIDKQKLRLYNEEAQKAKIKADFFEVVSSFGNGKLLESFSAFVEQAKTRQYRAGFNNAITDVRATWSIWIVPFSNQEPIFNPDPKANACTLKFSVFKNITNHYVLSVSSSMYQTTHETELNTVFCDDITFISKTELDTYLAKFTDAAFKWRDLQASDFTKR